MTQHVRFTKAPRTKVVLALAALIPSGCGAGLAPAAPSQAPVPTVRQEAVRNLVDQVAGGGYVLFFRHSARDAGAMPTAEVAIADNAGECRPGTELTPAGVEDAKAIGASFVRHGIRVERVYASPACRAAQMASLAFGTFQATRALSWVGMWGEGEGPTLATELRQLLGTPPSPGRTIVLISHNDVLKADRVGVEITLDQSEAAVFRPQGRHAFALVGRIPLQEWRR